MLASHGARTDSDLGPAESLKVSALRGSREICKQTLKLVFVALR